MPEIERKFLVRKLPEEAGYGSLIQQGYLAVGDGEVRLRKSGSDLRLTVKQGQGLVREEIEVIIDEKAFSDLWPATRGRRLAKVRHKIPLPGGLIAELDIYQGELNGLMIVEVEFPDQAEAENFLAPEWFASELTGKENWSNASLALHGIPEEN